MDRACRPGQPDVSEPIAIGDDPPECLIRRHSVAAPSVQSGNELVELVAPSFQFAGGS